MGEGNRQGTRDRRDRGHQDGLHAGRPGLQDGLGPLPSPRSECVGVVDHQDGVLAHETHELDHADHRHNAEGVTGQPQPQDPADDGHRDREHDIQRLQE